MTADNLNDDQYDEFTDGELPHYHKISHQITKILETLTYILNKTLKDNI